MHETPSPLPGISDTLHFARWDALTDKWRFYGPFSEFVPVQMTCSPSVEDTEHEV